MENFRRALLEWFGYSRRERRASLILLGALSIFTIVPYLITSVGKEPVNISYLLNSGDNAFNNSLSRTKPEELWTFDPNSASFDTLIQLGLTEKQAASLLNFRNKGGRLRRPEDIRKIYTIDEEISAKLIPYIKISGYTSDNNQSRDSASFRKKIHKIEINSADSAALVRLPGIGPVLSVRIIRYRKLIGGFASVGQLRDVYGLNEDLYLKIADRLYADPALITRLNINTAGEKELSRLPYLDKTEILAILKYRSLIGNIKNLQDLVDNKVITSEKGGKLLPYLKF
jgi:competence protein ComEA